MRVVLVLAEETFVEIKNLAQQTEKHRLYIMENSIPVGHRAKLIIEADEALKQMEKLADILGLESETYDTRRMIFTRLLGLEEDFGDVKPQKLRGYGEVSTKLAQVLEPWLEQFNMLIKSMLKSL